MPWLLLALGLVIMAAKSSPKKEDDGAALAADLAEIPDPVLREQVLKVLWTAGAADLSSLEVLASTLEAKGYTKAAARVRQKIAQIKSMTPPAQSAGGNGGV